MKKQPLQRLQPAASITSISTPHIVNSDTSRNGTFSIHKNVFRTVGVMITFFSVFVTLFGVCCEPMTATTTPIPFSISSSQHCQAYYQLSNNQSASIQEILSLDPLYPLQWHLLNTGQKQIMSNGGQDQGVAGNDVNIFRVWNDYRLAGRNVTVAIVDDGVDYPHEDISCGFEKNELSADISSGENASPYGTPVLSTDNHGTACAGVCCGRASNNKCGVGAAFESNIVSIRTLGDLYSDAIVANALSHYNDRIHIYSNSYGPPDDGVSLERYPLSAQALRNGVTKGRSGLGNIYVWASGNGASYGDTSDWDELANSPYTICVSATDWKGQASIYSESGTSTLINAPSSNFVASNGPSTSKIVTTDRRGQQGYVDGDCVSEFGGTSSSCPLAAGIIALILQARPELTWRDVQHILVMTSKRTDVNNPTWLRNGAGLYHSIDYGFGRIDAYEAVTAAKSWTLLTSEYRILDFKPQTSLGSGLTISTLQSNPSLITFTVDHSFQVEYAVLTLSVTTSQRGMVYFALRSPSGTISVMGRGRRNDRSPNIENQPFTSVQFWNETSAGQWTMSIYTTNEGVSLLTAASLTLQGGGHTFPAVPSVSKSTLQSISTLSPSVPSTSSANSSSSSSDISPTWDIPRNVRVAIVVIALTLVACVVLVVVFVVYLKKKLSKPGRPVPDHSFEEGNAVTREQEKNRGSFYYRD
ncbi:hypothetical protein C9374_003803 [Naegleria lovaniensis]|uniref:P/Homo B domain-containing protein n=1 Tax=Naegleria lovaniensis TaxID=51637 RepID=A0AA88H5Z6_NAELO|nr:uncharacterized protein C9374_003803 [Naegleria lovaniensis]KAG2394039.1 hypothetical protein C9374_003803 [Naegleria lovaniensis]